MKSSQLNSSSLEKIPEIWVLTDEISGHRSQVLGVAEALGHPFIIKNIVYNKKAKSPNFLQGASLKGIELEKSDKFSAPWPDLVIAAGRKTAPIARYIKKQTKLHSNKKCFLAQIMWPGFGSGDFDLIAVPEHDNKKEKSNIITTIGAPHRVTNEVLERELAMWSKTLGAPPRPRLALLVGGSAGKTHFTATHAEELGHLTKKLMEQVKGTLLFSNSRRTGDENTKILGEQLGKNDNFTSHFYDCKKSRANPYYAFLALADAIIVTGDSISMCSEACATGKPVYIFDPAEISGEKHKKMHKSLYDMAYAAKFSNDELQNIKTILNVAVAGERNPLDTAKQVAEKIKEKFVEN